VVETQVKQLAPLQQLEFLEAMQSERAVQQSCVLADGKAEAAHGDNDHSHNQTSQNELHDDSYSQARCGDQRQHQGLAEDVAAFGRLIVQLYRGRRIHHRASDHRWVLPPVRSAPSLPAYRIPSVLLQILLILLQILQILLLQILLLQILQILQILFQLGDRIMCPSACSSSAVESVSHLHPVACVHFDGLLQYAPSTLTALSSPLSMLITPVVDNSW